MPSACRTDRERENRTRHATTRAAVGRSGGRRGAVDGLLDATPDGPEPEDYQRLYDSIDPDALDGVFRSGFTGNVSFTYNGCHVVVTSENEVHATRLAALD